MNWISTKLKLQRKPNHNMSHLRDLRSGRTANKYHHQKVNNRNNNSKNDEESDDEESAPTMEKLFKLNTEMNQTLQFLSDKYDVFLKKITKVEQENKHLKKQNEELNIRLEAIEQEVNMQQQQRVKSHLTIHGIPHINNENLQNTVIETIKATKTIVTAENIISCRRMNAPDTTHKSPIIVIQIDNYDTKQKIQQNFKTNGPINLKQIMPNAKGFEERLVFINDYLTNFTRQLYEIAKKLKKKHNLRFAWTKDGKVFVRKTENSKIIRIKNLNDEEFIDNIILE